MNVDLHSHSLASDGLLAPAAVAARARAGGVDVWALTDHDDVSGLDEAAAAAAALGMRFVPGVEISVTWRAEPSHKGTTVHVVGLNIDPENAALADGLAAIRAGREDRARRIAFDLEVAGVPGALEGARKYAANPDLVSRTHFARFLVEAGKVPSTHAAFNRYLTEGKPGHVAHDWASLADAMDWIRAAGGVAVVAHPGRYKLATGNLNRFLAEFKDRGGAAIEVLTGSHTAAQYNHFAEVCRCFGFMASRGSDYHGPGESRVDPGDLPRLPADLTPVWQGW
ncbi:MAG: PHP domain-containing protein [Burkholderiales bacterium]|nr:PHP domain-containing protein [Burkholderiales bacterium]